VALALPLALGPMLRTLPEVCGWAALATALRSVRCRWASLMPALRAWALVGIGKALRDGWANAESGSRLRWAVVRPPGLPPLPALRLAPADLVLACLVRRGLPLVPLLDLPPDVPRAMPSTLQRHGP
jgi:hypothetical protein